MRPERIVAAIELSDVDNHAVLLRFSNLKTTR